MAWDALLLRGDWVVRSEHRRRTFSSATTRIVNAHRSQLRHADALDPGERVRALGLVQIAPGLPGNAVLNDVVIVLFVVILVSPWLY
jgi:hypothetical protein